MKSKAAASLTCLLLLGGCTYSSIVTKLSTKPTPPRTAAPARTASTHNAAPVQNTAPARNTAPASTTTQTNTEPPAAPASQIPGRMPLGIPPEEIPSPGECRVWLPQLPSDQQSASGQCSVVQQKVPAGAWVLHRSEEQTNEVAVNVYRSRWPYTVTETRYFDYWTGRFLRAE